MVVKSQNKLALPTGSNFTRIVDSSLTFTSISFASTIVRIANKPAGVGPNRSLVFDPILVRFFCIMVLN